MPLLEKITVLAQKAKENVISKTFITKDKRLEQSLSGNIKLNDFFFEKVATYGSRSSVGLVAFDCVAGLLAVADDSDSGYIKIFGKGVSSTIQLPKPVGVKYLQFRIGSPILVAIDVTNTIVTIDLRIKAIRHILQAQENITSQTYCIGTDWLFIGYANGYIDGFDIMEGRLTPYQIPNLLEADQDEEIVFDQEDRPRLNKVVDLQMHPTELNTLLIGYADTVFIWNIRESTIRRSFSLRKLERSNPYRHANLTCLAWNPKGSRFIGGYDDGCIHIWDVKNEQKPTVSRRLSENFFSLSSDQTEVVGPIFQLAWYVNESVQKSFVVVAGGLSSDDIQGLNILEFDLEGDLREPKKQSIMPLPTPLSHFLIMSHEPYESGGRNPFGIGVVGLDHSLTVYSFEHGFPTLKLPPALEFISPSILNACHLPQLPAQVFKKWTALTVLDRSMYYLPLSGGIAGPEHIYHVDSNDILLTVHQGEIVRFWDASYTALRPLSHLSIHCLDDLKSKDGFLCCVDANKTTGTFSIGFSNGYILLYAYQSDPNLKPEVDPRIAAFNQTPFVDPSEDTLQEISDLLAEMGEEPITVDTSIQSPASPKPEEIKSPVSPRKEFKSCAFETLKNNRKTAGFYAFLRISINSPIRSIASVGESIIAVSTVNGTLYVIDTVEQNVLFSHNIASSDYQNSVNTPTAPKSDTTTELPESDNTKEEAIKPPFIASIYFFNTYSPSNVMTIATQLFVSLSNGHVYQFDLSSLEKGLDVTPESLHNHLTLHTTSNTPIAEMHVVDLEGNSLSAIDQIKTPTEPSALARKKSSNALTPEDSIQSDVAPESEEASPKPSSLNPSSNSTASGNPLPPSKLMTAIGKAEYKQQDHPHYILIVSSQSVSVYLSGYNVRLYYKQFTKESEIVRSEVITNNNSVFLCLVTSNKRLAYYSLPVLDLMMEVGLPNSCVAERLAEASLSLDGRITYWSGKFELEQVSFIHKLHFPLGESVILYDAQRVIPPHPSVVTQNQRAKKTWFDTVAGAFQREPLTLPEFDSLMGRVPEDNPNEIRKQKLEAYKAKLTQSNEASSSQGPANVFAQLGLKVNERGDRLNELDTKFQDMSSASGDMLKALKDYNERQARKKWWEF